MEKKLSAPFILLIILSLGTFAIIFCYISYLYMALGYDLNHVWSYLYYDWKDLVISADEIPVYPNAEITSFRKNEPDVYYGHVNTWEFTTSDSPEKVWKFYVDEMSRKWGFYEAPIPEYPLQLVILSCPTHRLTMSSSEIDELSHQVTIQFLTMPCH